MANLNDLVQAVSDGTVREEVFQYHYTNGTWGAFSEHNARLRYEAQMSVVPMRNRLLNGDRHVYEAQVQTQQQNGQRQADSRYRFQRNLKVGIGGSLAAIFLCGVISASDAIQKYASLAGVALGVGIAASAKRKEE